MKKIFSIAWYTFVECARNKILLALFVFLFTGAACLGFFRYMTPAEEVKLIKDFCFGAANIVGIIISIILPISVISIEMEKLTIYTILSKPVRRWEYIAAKFLGVMMTMLAVLAVTGVVFLGILRAREGFFDIEILKSLLLYFFKFSIVSAFSVLLNILTSTHVFAIILSFSFYILGNITDYLEDMIGHLTVEYSKSILSYAVKLLPNLSGFDVSESIALGTTVAWGYIAKLAAYSILYSAVSLFIAVLCFRKKDL